MEIPLATSQFKKAIEFSKDLRREFPVSLKRLTAVYFNETYIYKGGGGITNEKFNQARNPFDLTSLTR